MLNPNLRTYVTMGELQYLSSAFERYCVDKLPQRQVKRLVVQNLELFADKIKLEYAHRNVIGSLTLSSEQVLQQLLGNTVADCQVQALNEFSIIVHYCLPYEDRDRVTISTLLKKVKSETNATILDYEKELDKERGLL